MMMCLGIYTIMNGIEHYYILLDDKAALCVNYINLCSLWGAHLTLAGVPQGSVVGSLFFLLLRP